MIICTNVPGKLFIAGEYAVTSGAPAILSPVPRYLSVTLKSNPHGRITSAHFKEAILWERQGESLVGDINKHPIIAQTIKIVSSYVNDHTCTWDIAIASDLDDVETGKKYGLGSSGALTVALVEALLQFYKRDYDGLLLYKLSCLVHIALKSNGSFGDIATSAFKTAIVYRKFDDVWLQEQEISISELVNMEWHNLQIEPITLPKKHVFLVGWSGTPASTEQLVADIKQLKNTPEYEHFVANSTHCVNAFVDALKKEDINGIAHNIRTNRTLLQQLSCNLETPLLTTLCNIAEEHHAASKVSGAGGGDCGICFTSLENIPAIQNAWQQNGIQPLFTLQP